MKIGGDMNFVVTELTGNKWGRPILLGEKIDANVQTIIRLMRDSRAVVNTAIAIVTAVGIVLKRDKLLLNKTVIH